MDPDTVIVTASGDKILLRRQKSTGTEESQTWTLTVEQVASLFRGDNLRLAYEQARMNGREARDKEIAQLKYRIRQLEELNQEAAKQAPAILQGRPR